jgi:hypothetical protein
MFVLKNKNQMDKAITRCRQIRPTVKFDCFGRYRVSGSKGGYYTVICRKDERGIKTVECTCRAGDRGIPCFHAASVLGLHIWLSKQRQATN